jgi:hypothetical protein
MRRRRALLLLILLTVGPAAAPVEYSFPVFGFVQRTHPASTS